tara:strand:- start:1618 stop:2004 length:387 start_codon:yes stop_codon:yes gene_type:complete
MTDLNLIETLEAPLPLGHYSQATVIQGCIYVSGQLPIDPFDDKRHFDTPEEQTLQTLRNLKAVVESAGGQLGTIAKVGIFITDIDFWPKVNFAYSQFFGEYKPARTAVPVVALPKGYLIEIDAVAYVA